jgi:mannose-6-phosphate isomerase-like protein (cupin superfamily)
MSIASLQTGRHYVWGGNCDGWNLAASLNLSVIQGRVPSGSSEARHLHKRAEQFFYVLNGIAKFEVAGGIHVRRPNEGFHVSPGVPHTLSNQHEPILEFLLVSNPPGHGDREEA